MTLFKEMWFEKASVRAGILNSQICLANHQAHVTGPAFYDTAHVPDFSRCLNFAPKS